MLHHRRIDRRRDLLRPGIDVPEIRRAEEIDVEGFFFLVVVVATSTTTTLRQYTIKNTTPLHMRLRIRNLLLNAGRFLHLIKILHADIAARARGAGGVVFPDVGVDAPAFAVPFVFEGFVQHEAAEEDDLAACFAEGGDPRLGEPLGGVGVVIFEDAGELGVGSGAGAFAFETED